MLTPGSPMPAIELEDTTGHAWSLPGQRATLIYFVRSTSCPICTHHVRDLIAHRNNFDANNIQVFIAIPEDAPTGSAWKARHAIPFPVLVGTATTPHESIGLSRKVFGSMQQSGTLLIDRNGLITHLRTATLPTAGYHRKALLAAMDALPVS